MRDSFRFLTGHSDGASSSGEAQEFCYNALVALVEYNEGLVDTTIVPFNMEHRGRSFRIESLSYVINPMTNRRRYVALIQHGRYICELTHTAGGIDA